MKRFLFSTFLLVTIGIPTYTFALNIGAPFGGFVTAVVPCTCSGGLWMQYTPFFFGTDIPASGALYIPPSAVIYQYFQLVPGTWELGSYIPSAGACFVPAPNPADPCVFLPAGGIVEYTGTSSLAPISLLSGLGFGF